MHIYSINRWLINRIKDISFKEIIAYLYIRNCNYYASGKTACRIISIKVELKAGG